MRHGSPIWEIFDLNRLRAFIDWRLDGEFASTVGKSDGVRAERLCTQCITGINKEPRRGVLLGAARTVIESIGMRN